MGRQAKQNISEDGMGEGGESTHEERLSNCDWELGGGEHQVSKHSQGPLPGLQQAGDTRKQE